MAKGRFHEMSPEEWAEFNKDIKIVTGMLYTIAKWPLKPFIPAFYKTAREYKKDYEPIYNPPIDE